MAMHRLVRVRQNFPKRALPDVAAAVRQTMEAAEWTQSVKPGSRIAVGAGSRGIQNIDVIVKAVVDFWKSRGCEPFIVPVMGSHGAATAEGQADVLHHYGITEERMGAPILSSLEVVKVGTTPEGIEVSMDRNAFEADGVMLCSRVKWHTDFEGGLESGVHKMMAIGLGKWAGAKRYHTWALKIGMEQVIRSVGQVVLSTGKMLGGLAILEDAWHNTAEVAALGVEGMVAAEEALLEKTKSWKTNIPAKAVDLLVVDEMGKNFSGAGMDTKVINRSVDGPNRWTGVPVIQRVFVRNISNKSYGNAIGVGFADITTDRLVEQIDYNATWINGLTSSTTSPGATPMHFASDKECIERILPTCGNLNVDDCTIVWIPNSMDLAECMVSENLLPELRQNADIEVVGEPAEMAFDADGNLVAAFEPALAAH
ncbi:MAG: DUF2088 domain-containing protein [Acidobacteria bacterium]|nr:DUF2088 domain-containing protein [Acidobacteriota bacterium]